MIKRLAFFSFLRVWLCLLSRVHVGSLFLIVAMLSYSALNFYYGREHTAPRYSHWPFFYLACSFITRLAQLSRPILTNNDLYYCLF
jgi:hypothetical protein